jgi:hypothetical protein
VSWQFGSADLRNGRAATFLHRRRSDGVVEVCGLVPWDASPDDLGLGTPVEIISESLRSNVAGRTARLLERSTAARTS